MCRLPPYTLAARIYSLALMDYNINPATLHKRKRQFASMWKHKGHRPPRGRPSADAVAAGSRVNDTFCGPSLHCHKEPDSALRILAVNAEILLQPGQMVLEQTSARHSGFEVHLVIPPTGIDEVLMRDDFFHPVFVKDAFEDLVRFQGMLHGHLLVEPGLGVRHP